MDRQSYLYTGQAQDAEQIWPGMTAWGFDHEDILLGMAPKPVLVLAVKYDFFPIEGTRRTVRRARRIWKRFEKGSDLKLFEDRSIHRYTRPLARAAGRFFAKVLDGRTNVRFTDDAIQPIEPSDLWCTASGQVRGDFPRSRAVFHENRDRLKAAEKTRPPKRKQQAAARRWVKKQVCTGRQRSEPNLRVYNTADLDGLYGEMGLYFSQPGMCNFAVALQRPLGEPSRGVTVALWEKGTAGIETHMDWISAECGTGRCVLVVDVTGLGAAEPYALSHIPTHAVYGSMHKLCDDLSWLDDSLAAIRVWDLLALPKVIDDWPGLDGGDIRLYTEGPFNVYAELAALLEPALSAITTHQPMETFASWVTERYYNLRHKPEVILPGLLQLADLDDLRRWRG
jgi:hypothetical protein